MIKKMDYKNTPDDLGDAILQSEPVLDFLPSPDQLILKEDTIKTTIDLSRKSVLFFKNEAKRNHTSYQKMLRKVVDLYVDHYSSPKGGRR